MTTLRKRATPAQARIYRAVEGAARDAISRHRNWLISDPRLPGSIAKRAAGTLTAGWPDVLALRDAASDREGVNSNTPTHGEDSLPSVPVKAGAVKLLGGRPRSYSLRKRLLNTIGAMAGQARRAGNAEREAALVEVLRLIATPQNGR